MLKISFIEESSIGEELELSIGDCIVAFDGYPANDVIDYYFYDSKDSFVMTVKESGGEEFDVEIEKDEDETLGLSFEDEGMAIKTCHNNCMFCFVAQMPKGMRDTLYVKDDDYRQSFTCGNFVTLTNLKDEDVDRIIRYKLSPLYVSVHTMNGELRCKMMNNRFAYKIGDYLKRFAEAGIVMHTQIVLVPGVNDGAELEYSARELFKLYPNVQSMAVVPCGITKYRQGLAEIVDPNAEYCKKVIEIADKLNAEFKENFVTLADEFFFKAGLKTKPFEFYGEFPQIENGVGMTAKFLYELEQSLEQKTCKKTVLIVTGTSAENLIRECALKVEKYCKCLKTHVIGVKNDFFGATVNCSGLLTGKDILNACKGFSAEYDELIITRSMLKEFEDVFLCGMTVEELSKTLSKPIRITNGTGESFFCELTAERE